MKASPGGILLAMVLIACSGQDTATPLSAPDSVASDLAGPNRPTMTTREVDGSRRRSRLLLTRAGDEHHREENASRRWCSSPARVKSRRLRRRLPIPLRLTSRVRHRRTISGSTPPRAT